MNPRERFLAAARGEPHDRPPVWLMRQAGRYLPEYRELREKYGFLEMVRKPELAVEVSLQPWRRFGVDAVILFSDILIPVSAMGVRLSFEEGTGPLLDRTVESVSDIARLARPHVRTQLSFTTEAIEALRQEVGDEAALLGFVGSPWTIACYMTEGGSGEFNRALSMARGGGEMVSLLDFLSDALSEYAVAQARAGCDAVQVFDTWAGLLEPGEYAELVLPRVKRICDSISEAGAVPILFIRESARLLEAMRDSGAQVASLGPRTDLPRAWEILGEKMATQGNIDPEKLLASPASVVGETEALLSAISKRHGHIVNLGHGVLPKTRPDCVKAFVDTVKNWREMPEARG